MSSPQQDSATPSDETVQSSSSANASPPPSPPAPVTAAPPPWFALPTMATVDPNWMMKLSFRMIVVATHPIPVLGFFQNAPKSLQEIVVLLSFASMTCFIFSRYIALLLKTRLRYHPPSFRIIMIFFIVAFLGGIGLLFTAFYFLMFMAAATSLVKCFLVIVPLVNVFLVLRYDDYLYVPFH